MLDTVQMSIRIKATLYVELNRVAKAQKRPLSRVVEETLALAMEGGLVLPDTPATVAVKAKVARQVMEKFTALPSVSGVPEVASVTASGTCFWCDEKLVPWGPNQLHCPKCRRNFPKE